MNETLLYQAIGYIDDQFLEECEAHQAAPLPWRRWGALAACFAFAAGAVLLLHGQDGNGGLLPPPEPSYSFCPGEVPPPETVPAPDADKASGSEATHTLTLEEALESHPYGIYLPARTPEGFSPDSIVARDGEAGSLLAVWTKGPGAFEELDWQIRPYDPEDASRITPVSETRNYDLGLYSLPFSDSVPEELWEVVDCPIFPAKELTQEAVDRRIYTTGESGEEGSLPRARFAVLYDKVVVEVTAKGVSPQWLYEALSGLPRD